MIEGAKVIVSRILMGFAVIICMVVYHIVSAYAHTQNLTAFNNGSLVGVIASLDSNVYIAYFVVFSGIGLSVYHLYYRIVQKRRAEFDYSESGWSDGMYGR